MASVPPETNLSNVKAWPSRMPARSHMHECRRYCRPPCRPLAAEHCPCTGGGPLRGFQAAASSHIWHSPSPHCRWSTTRPQADRLHHCGHWCTLPARLLLLPAPQVVRLCNVAWAAQMGGLAANCAWGRRVLLFSHYLPYLLSGASRSRPSLLASLQKQAGCRLINSHLCLPAVHA